MTLFSIDFRVDNVTGIVKYNINLEKWTLNNTLRSHFFRSVHLYRKYSLLKRVQNHLNFFWATPPAEGAFAQILRLKLFHRNWCSTWWKKCFCWIRGVTGWYISQNLNLKKIITHTIMYLTLSHIYLPFCTNIYVLDLLHRKDLRFRMCAISSK